MKLNISAEEFLNEEKSYLIVGPNGSGKSLFIERVISKAIEKNIKYSYMPQISKLNLSFENWINFLKISKLTEISNSKLKKLINKFSASKIINNKNKELSDGQISIINFIKTLSIKSNLYILDEFTNGMDFVNREIALKIITDLKNSGAKILICSHDLNIINNMKIEKIEMEDE